MSPHSLWAPVLKWIDLFGQNLRYATRVLARSPSFTLIAVTSLALGIAVNTTLFSVFNSLLLKPLGAGGDELVRIGRSARGEREFRSASYEELTYLREHAASFTSIAGHQIEQFAIGGAEGALPVSAELVAGTYFSTLKVPPRRGRDFGVGEDGMHGQAAVAVISDRFWHRHFASDSAIVGRTIRINDHPFTIIGVAPPGFSGTFPGVDVDLWLPAGMARMARPGSQQDSETSLMLLGRLRAGVTAEAAEAELELLARQMVEAGSDPERTFVVASARGAHPLFAGVLRIFLLMLMAVVAVVLLIACANVAGLLLARARSRRGEVAVRLAIGASRAQVVGQLLVESVLLAMLGGLSGLVLSIWPLKMLNSLTFVSGPTGAPIFLDLRLDARVLVFTAAASLLTAVAFGLVPAVQATHVALTAALKDPRSTAGIARFRLGSALVVVQVCVSFILLVGAMLLFRSLHNTGRVDVGFDPDHVFVATVDLGRLGYDPSRIEGFYAELLARARELPGVERAAFANFVPLSQGTGHPWPLKIAGVTPSPGQQSLTVAVAQVSDEYFATVQQRLIRGRDFDAADRTTTRRVAIVNETMAKRYWPGSDALGKRVGLGEDLAEYEIVGIAANARFASFGGEVEPLVFVPEFNRGKLYLRTTSQSSDVLSSVRRLAQEIDAQAAPHVSGQSMRERMASSMSLVPVRIARAVFGVAGCIALLLAAGGLYGLVSYTVEHRMKEIGIRVAMGANRQNVFRVIVGGAFRLTVVGLVIGIGIAAGVMRLLSSFLFGLSPTDPLTFAGIAGLLMFITFLAGYTAARRGLNVDPMLILRCE